MTSDEIMAWQIMAEVRYERLHGVRQWFYGLTPSGRYARMKKATRLGVAEIFKMVNH